MLRGFTVTNPFNPDEPDDKPSPAKQARIHKVERNKLLGEVIGHSFYENATIPVGADLVRVRFWAPHRRIAIDRLLKGIALDDPAIVQRAEKLRALGISTSSSRPTRSSRSRR